MVAEVKRIRSSDVSFLRAEILFVIFIALASSYTPVVAFARASRVLSNKSVNPSRRRFVTEIQIPRGGVSPPSTRLNFASVAVASIDAFFRTAPYTAAFITCGVQSSAADLLAQFNAARQTQNNTSSNNDSSRETTPAAHRTPSFRSMFDIKRNLSFLIYGGFYLGCAFEWLYNNAYPRLFGDTINVQTVLGKVLIDLLILAPLVTLPISYVIRAIIYRTPIRQELLSYWKDVKHQHVLSKYCAMYFPVTLVAFTWIPQHYRVRFFAFVDFTWVLLFSSISSGDSQVVQASNSSSSTIIKS